MITKALIVAAFSVAAVFSPKDAFSATWTLESGGNGHTYTVTPSRMNWDTAEAYAISLGGHLVSINSPAEQAFIEATFLQGVDDRSVLWIGLNDVAVEGSFIWTTGEAVTFTNWDPVGEPNNFGNEDYTAINWYRGADAGGLKGSWNDVHINGTTSPSDPIVMPYFGIVEVVPEPSVGLFTLIGVAMFASRRKRR